MRINTLFIISIVLFLVAIISIIVINQIENDKMSDTFKYLREELTKDINTYNFDENIYNKNLSNIPLYFINLPKSKDRKKFLDKQIKEYNIKNTKIIEAVYGKNKIPLKKENMFKIVMKTQKPIIFFNNDKSATDGEIGCTLSHLNTILHAYNNNLEFVIICEDDVDLYWIKTWDKTINDIIRQAPHDWEYINLKKFASRSKQKYRKYVLGQTTACQLLNRKEMYKEGF